ncbi:MAG: phage holin family protein [Cyclobacteriaceae bacterium]|nr:phage holin family protein [Cyclobacteriaceae bacterium]
MADYKKLLGFLKVDSIFDDLIAIIEAKVELLKIELKEEAAKAATKIISAVFLGIMVFLIVLFLSITIATLLNELLNSHFWGFAIITGFYILLLIAFKVFNIGKKLENYIEASLNNLHTEEEEEVGDEE